jgi:hypothetical protein
VALKTLHSIPTEENKISIVLLLSALEHNERKMIMHLMYQAKSAINNKVPSSECYRIIDNHSQTWQNKHCRYNEQKNKHQDKQISRQRGL